MRQRLEFHRCGDSAGWFPGKNVEFHTERQLPEAGPTSDNGVASNSYPVRPS